MESSRQNDKIYNIKTFKIPIEKKSALKMKLLKLWRSLARIKGKQARKTDFMCILSRERTQENKMMIFRDY
jgi:hypothetical protein